MTLSGKLNDATVMASSPITRLCEGGALGSQEPIRTAADRTTKRPLLRPQAFLGIDPPTLVAKSGWAYLPAFFCFFAWRFSLRFFWAAFLATFPAPLSFVAMISVYSGRRGYGRGTDCSLRPTYPAVNDCEALPAEPACMLGFMARYQPATGGHDSPPRQTLFSREHVAHGSGRTRVTRLLGHFTVCSDLPSPQLSDDAAYPPREPTAPVSAWPSHRSLRTTHPAVDILS
jgi:hypothetical protein